MTDVMYCQVMSGEFVKVMMTVFDDGTGIVEVIRWSSTLGDFVPEIQIYVEFGSGIDPQEFNTFVLDAALEAGGSVESAWGVF